MGDRSNDRIKECDEVLLPLYKPCGIENPGSLCYMISIIQHLYSCTPFRELIIPQKDSFDQSPVASALHELFTRLYFNASGEAITMDDLLIQLMRQTSSEGSSSSAPSIDAQQDAAQYFSFLSSCLEATLPAMRVHQIPWVGRLVHIIQRGPAADLRSEKFFYVSLNVKGSNGDVSRNNLYAALQDFTSPLTFPVAGAEIVKTCKFERLPSRLLFHLKRFDYSYSTRTTLKVNEYFSFPHTIDMTEFLHRDNSVKDPSTFIAETDRPMESDGLGNGSRLFALSGVVVHKGTAASGHYYSLVRCRRESGSDEWVKLDDAEVTAFEAAALESTCFGVRRCDDEKNSSVHENALFLVYDVAN